MSDPAPDYLTLAQAMAAGQPLPAPPSMPILAQIGDTLSQVPPGLRNPIAGAVSTNPSAPAALNPPGPLVGAWPQAGAPQSPPGASSMPILAQIRDTLNQVPAALRNPFTGGSSLIPWDPRNQTTPGPTGVTHRTWGEDRSPPPLVFPGAGGAQAGTDAIARYSPLPAAGVAKVAAQNIDLTAPEYQERLQAGLADVGGALQGKADLLRGAGAAKANAALEQAAGIGAEREAVGGVSEENRRQNDAADKRVRELEDARATAMQEVKRGRLTDSEANKSYARKALDILGGAVGGFTQAWNKLPENPVVAAQQAERDRQMGLQKGNLALQRASLGDFTQQLQDALKIRAQQQEAQQGQAALALKGAALLPQQAALASQAPIEAAEGQTKAADVGVQQAELGVTGAKEAMAEHKYIPPHTVATGPDMAAIRKTAEKIYTDSKQDMTPQEALRQAIVLHTGHDITPGAPFQGIAPVPHAGGAAATAAQQQAAVDDSLSRISATGEVAARNVGLGTRARAAITPGGTVEQDSVNAYNAQGAALLKSVEGRLPQEEAERVFHDNYAMVPGLSEEQKRARMRAFQNHVRSMIGVKGKPASGGGAEEGGGGTPSGFTEAGAE